MLQNPIELPVLIFLGLFLLLLSNGSGSLLGGLGRSETQSVFLFVFGRVEGDAGLSTGRLSDFTGWAVRCVF
jgi:hypothetical protein